jgi:hypothetical protein
MDARLNQVAGGNCFRAHLRATIPSMPLMVFSGEGPVSDT